MITYPDLLLGFAPLAMRFDPHIPDRGYQLMMASMRPAGCARTGRTASGSTTTWSTRVSRAYWTRQIATSSKSNSNVRGLTVPFFRASLLPCVRVTVRSLSMDLTSRVQLDSTPC